MTTIPYILATFFCLLTPSFLQAYVCAMDAAVISWTVCIQVQRVVASRGKMHLLIRHNYEGRVNRALNRGA
jgi:hypothetical protein